MTTYSSNLNLALYSSDLLVVKNPKITFMVDSGPLTSNNTFNQPNSFSVQMNCTSPAAYWHQGQTGWHQYILEFIQGQISYTVSYYQANTYYLAGSSGGLPGTAPTNPPPLPLQSGYAFEVTLETDPSTFTVQAMHTRVLKPDSSVLSDDRLVIANVVSGSTGLPWNPAWFAPIGGFTVCMVGIGAGDTATFKTGSGRFLYSPSGFSVAVWNGSAYAYPANVVVNSAIHTAEPSNMKYGDYSSGAQLWGLSIPSTIPTTITVTAKPH